MSRADDIALARALFGPPPREPSHALQVAAIRYPYCPTCHGYRPAHHDHNPPR